VLPLVTVQDLLRYLADGREDAATLAAIRAYQAEYGVT
jgi:orotate phosphoribosyltransferase